MQQVSSVFSLAAASILALAAPSLTTLHHHRQRRPTHRQTAKLAPKCVSAPFSSPNLFTGHFRTYFLTSTPPHVLLAKANFPSRCCPETISPSTVRCSRHKKYNIYVIPSNCPFIPQISPFSRGVCHVITPKRACDHLKGAFPATQNAQSTTLLASEMSRMFHHLCSLGLTRCPVGRVGLASPPASGLCPPEAGHRGWRDWALLGRWGLGGSGRRAATQQHSWLPGPRPRRGAAAGAPTAAPLSPRQPQREKQNSV